MALKSANQPIRWKERIGIMAVGHAFKQAEEVTFDYVIYPAVIAWLGAAVGGLVMTLLSAFACWLYILFYDWAKRDWLGLELAKKFRDGEEKRGITRFIQKATQKGDWLAFIALSCTTDPFVTTVYMRRGAEKYNGLSYRDWGIFAGSLLVGNFLWIGIMSVAVEGIRYVLRMFGFT